MDVPPQLWDVKNNRAAGKSAQAIQHRLDTAGLTRKIGTNQVRALRIMLSGIPEEKSECRPFMRR